MTTRRFLQLDVFSALPGSGNPLAVVLDAEGLDDAAMQAIARWTKLPETTFVFPASDAASSYRLRMFSPQKEVPFAGHPSVGTAHAVLDAGLAAPRDGVLMQDGIAGQLPLRVEQIAGHRSIAIRTPRARVTEQVQADDPRLSDSLRGWPLGALPPALMDGGRTWWVVELASEAALRSLDPDWNAIAALAESTGSMGVFAYARAAAPAPTIWRCAPSSAMAAVSRTRPPAPPTPCLRPGWIARMPCPAPTAATWSARAAKSASTRCWSCASMPTARSGRVDRCRRWFAARWIGSDWTSLAHHRHGRRDSCS